MECENVVNKIEDSIKEDKRWCVYMHTNKINNKKYIGKTCQKPEYRWNNGQGYKGSPHFYRAILKDGWENFTHEILADGLSAEDACEMEKLLIQKYDTTNRQNGYNLTSGGDGRTDWVVPEETRRKISNARKGIVFSQETRKKMSEAKMGRILSESEKEKLRSVNLGKTRSLETRQKMGESKIGPNNPTSYPIYCIELDEIFWGQKDAASLYGVCKEGISACIRGKNHYAGRHPQTNEPLHWLRASEAIDCGYITQEQVNNYLNSIKRGNDNED